MSLYFALLIVLLICLFYNKLLFLIVLLSSILLIPVQQYLGGDAWRCDIEGDCINREYGDYTEYPNDYLTENVCKADCPKRFITPVPEEFIQRINEGGDLYRPYRQFSKDFPRIEKYMSVLGSIGINVVKGRLFDRLSSHVARRLLEGRFPNDFRGMLIQIKGHITNDKVWWENLDSFTDELSQNPGRFIHFPIGWEFNLDGKSGAHTVTGLVDTKTKIIHIIDSNIDYSVDAEKERELYHQLLSSEFKNYKLNMSMNYWYDQTCPLALQRAIGTGSCQTWVIYTSLLYMLNIDIPKKELIEIENKHHEKSPELLTQLLFYIYQTLPEIRNILNSWVRANLIKSSKN